MTFVDDLKDKMRRHDRVNIIREVHRSPEYNQVLDKLQELNDKREELYRVLAKLELDIDACLVLIEMKRQKQEIDDEKILKEERRK